MVFSVIRAVIHNIRALMTMWISPRVRMYSGIEMSWTIGLMMALTSPKITATTKMIPTLCRVESPPTKLMPGTTRVTTHNANPVSRGANEKPVPWG